ncbi:MAG: hypothetical protein ABFD92_18000 [Planctomycetaceae bacterium]|nr:hypothetical protein [Planctomycetaceae bacterium]
MFIPDSDVKILRDLAKRVLEVSHDPVNVERRNEWFRHRRLEPGRPMILIEQGEIGPLVGIGERCICKDNWARGQEYGMRSKLYMFEEVQDDHVVEPTVYAMWGVGSTDYGVQPVTHSAPTADGARGSVKWDPPIQDLDKDFDKLKPRTFSVHREGTLEEKARLEEVFDGIFDVQVGGWFWWTMGMTGTAINLIGLEGLMMAMYDNPKGLHRLMAFLRDDHVNHALFVEKEGLLALNNRDHYIGSGSLGYTHELPSPGYTEGGPVRLKDQWVLSESQETVGVSPAMFDEFIYPYQLDLMKRFGLTYYGCCEPVNNRWHILKNIPNLRAISVSPWADQDVMAEGCGRKVIFCRKPNPASISTPKFDEEALKADVRATCQAARKCNFEIVMKDIHTFSGDRTRPVKWVKLAREVCDEFFA